MPATPPPRSSVDWRQWIPDAVLGALVLVAGIVEEMNADYYDFWRGRVVALVVIIALAVGLARRLPGLALALVWLACVYQVAYEVPVLFVELAIGVVAFGTARWGQPITVALSALSIPFAGIVAVLFLDPQIFNFLIDDQRYQTFIDAAQRLSDRWQVVAAFLGMACLGVPWLAGLALRFRGRAEESQVTAIAAQETAARAQRESEQAREIARLRAEQTQLAHDVHDVVGHSLAVILAQAESAQFLDEADTAALRLSMQNIATSARSSLQNVRQVLTPSAGEPAGPGELHDLVEGVRASGHEVVFSEAGTSRPMAPDLATVAYRVLQEMLTNAIRHGRRDSPVEVELQWSDDLRIEVANVVGPDRVASEEDDDAGGQGLDGMRRRLDTAGGRLDLRRRETGDGETFTATAWVPVRTVYP
jgi:signal transduction histidine kinase